MVGCRLKPLVSGAHFEGMLVTLCGYCVIALSLVAVHAAVARLRLRRVARMLGELLPDQKKKSAAERKKIQVHKKNGWVAVVQRRLKFKILYSVFRQMLLRKK